jgi:adenylate cyclase
VTTNKVTTDNDIKDNRQLPQRVLQKINAHQANSERLIAWVQLLIAIIFSVLYAISPKTFSEDATFEPVPWVLSAYFIFTIIHIVHSHRNKPCDWFAYLSIIVDMALVYILIWSFHLQYMQPASFYLKVPTLLYIFIFIALRALRFEIKFILFAGAVAATGWLLMILYVIFSDPNQSMITKDYIHYLTSNTVLLGAEFDKIISMLIVSLILATAVYRARKLLIDSVIETNVAQDLAHFVPTQVVKDLKSSDTTPLAGKASSYSAAIMFTDIVSFTTISEKLSPAQIVTTLNGYFAALEKVLDNYGGTINQFQGDAILASFDQPKNGLSASECAVQAALDIQHTLKDQLFGEPGYETPLQTRIGINTGEVVGGFIGSTQRLIYTVHGDAVNLAARLEQLNKKYDTLILVAEDTCSACKEGMFTFTPKGETTVKGRSSIVQVFSIE